MHLKKDKKVVVDLYQIGIWSYTWIKHFYYRTKGIRKSKNMKYIFKIIYNTMYTKMSNILLLLQHKVEFCFVRTSLIKLDDTTNNEI